MDKFNNFIFTTIQRIVYHRYTELEETVAVGKLTRFLVDIEDSTDVAKVLNTVDHTGQTLVQMAAKAHNWSILQVLLQKGGLADGVNSEARQLELMALILERGADRDHRDYESITMSAACSLLPVTDWLRETIVVDTMFHRMAVANERRFAEREQFESVINELTTMLLSRGVDINGVCEPGKMTVLQLAAHLQHWEIVKYFIDCRADPCVPDPDGVTIFHHMSSSSRLIHRRDKLTALCSSLNKETLDLVKLLQEKGLDINAEDQHGNTPLNVALCQVVPHSDLHCCHMVWILVACDAKLNLNKLSDCHKEFLIRSWAYLPDSLLPLSPLKEGTDCGVQSHVLTMSQLKEVFYCVTHSRKVEDLKLFRRVITDTLYKAVAFRHFPKALLLIQCFKEIILTLREPVVLLLISNYYLRGNSMHSGFYKLLDIVLSKGANPNWSLHTCQKIPVTRISGEFVQVSVNISVVPDDLKCRPPCPGIVPLHYVISCAKFLKGMESPCDLAKVLRILLSHGANPLAMCHCFSLLRVVLGMCYGTNTCEKHLVPILRLLIEAGVSTHQQHLTNLGAQFHLAEKQCQEGGVAIGSIYKCHHVPRPYYDDTTLSPLRMTLNCGLMKIIVLSGACSNKELFLWNREVEALPQSAVPQDTRSTLAELASNVQPLSSLARRAVSHAIGCGPRRQQFLRSNSIPRNIKMYVQFQDIFKEEEATGKQD
ncbi:hypothetical protein ACOMHN_028121 [Nucella lapillus]